MSRYLLDTTVLIAHLRGDGDVVHRLRVQLGAGHELVTACVPVAEVESGLLPRERARAGALLRSLGFLATTKEAALRAGRYQAEWRRKGVSLATADTLVAGTARAHGAVVVTDNLDDFPMGDLRVEAPPGSAAEPGPPSGSV